MKWTRAQSGHDADRHVHSNLGAQTASAWFQQLEKAYAKHIRQTARTFCVDCRTHPHKEIPDAIVEYYLRYVCYRTAKAVFTTRERMDTSVVNAIKKGKLAPMLTVYMGVHTRLWYCT
jgi:hypothetical protein